jgi:hypothetical protein
MFKKEYWALRFLHHLILPEIIAQSFQNLSSLFNSFQIYCTYSKSITLPLNQYILSEYSEPIKQRWAKWCVWLLAPVSEWYLSVSASRSTVRQFKYTGHYPPPPRYPLILYRQIYRQRSMIEGRKVRSSTCAKIKVRGTIFDFGFSKSSTFHSFRP